MVSIYGGSGGGGFDYVQDPSPQDPSEGEEWYDTGSDSAFVYTGSAWVEQTITDHSKLSGIGSSDHHSRYTDAEARDAVSGAGFNRRTSTQTIFQSNGTSSWVYDNALPLHIEADGYVDWENGNGAGLATINVAVYVDGTQIGSSTVASEQSSGQSNGSTQFHLTDSYNTIGDGSVSQTTVEVSTNDPGAGNVVGEVNYGVLLIEG